jgi:putative colanic acid biosynthesis UDP-glucose lipid carrier transferase
MLYLGSQKHNLAIATGIFIANISGAIVATISLWLAMYAFDVSMNDAYMALLVITGLLGIILMVPGRKDELFLAWPSWQWAIWTTSSWMVVCGILLLLGYMTKTSDWYSRKLLFSWALATPFLVTLSYIAIARIVGRLSASSTSGRRAVIAGATDAGLRLANRLAANPLFGLTVDGFFEDRHVSRIEGAEDLVVLGALTDVGKYVRSHDIAVVFIALPMRNVSRVMRLLDELQDTTVSMYFIPDVFVFDLIQSRAIDFSDVHAVALCETPFYGFKGVIKRASDIAIALVALIILSPLLLAIAVAVKLTSPGSVLFKQRRYGLDGEEIIVYKFRSMTVSEDSEKVRQATRNDQRLTKIGGVLRRYSLDELPQFVNVLQGRMSVVGPRPHAVAHNEQYRGLIKGYMVRHKVAPGITGLAQVSGYRGETKSVEKMNRRIELDLEYLRNWSPALDIQIILKTIVLLFFDKSAY